MNTNHKPPTMVKIPEGLPEGGLSAGREANPVIDDNPKQGTSRPPAIISTITPMEMLNAAVSRGADLDVLTKLMDLQERWEKAQARKAFDDAVASAKADIKPIPKNREGHNGRKYADMAGIASVIDPLITDHGLSYRFRTVQNDRNISVTCVLSHRAGHYEENTLVGPADVSGSKNAIQAVGSTLTYLQRYALIQALGLSVTEDDDGESAGPPLKTGTSIHFEGDYAGGVPEKLTKPKQEPRFSRAEAAAEAWEAKADKWQRELSECESIDALHEWGTANSIPVSGAPDHIKKEIYTSFKKQLEWLEKNALAGQVVHEEDGERPARPDDFDDKPSISKRAIAAREKSDETLSPEQIADLLRS